MKYLISNIVLVVVLTSVAAAAPPVPTPAPLVPPSPAPKPLAIQVASTMKAQPGRLGVIRVKTTEPNVKWINLDEDNLDLIELNPTTAIVSAQVPGKYRVLVLVARDSATSYAICTVTVSNPVPVPPAPGPVPPAPGPVPPSNPLVRALQAAFLAELSPDRAAHLKTLAALYRQAAATAADPNVATWGKLFQAIATAAKTLGVSGQIPAVQGVVMGELRKVLPTTSGLRMDAAARDLASKTFIKVAMALEAVR